MKKRPAIKIQLERLPAVSIRQELEIAYDARDAAQARIATLIAKLPKPTKIQAAAQQQASADDRLLNDFDRRLRQVCALGDLLTDAHCPVGDSHGGASDVIAGRDGWLILSIFSDLTQGLRDDWENRIQHLMSEGRKAELAIGLAKAGVKVRP